MDQDPNQTVVGIRHSVCSSKVPSGFVCECVAVTALVTGFLPGANDAAVQAHLLRGLRLHLVRQGHHLPHVQGQG